jgi:hypothetical protein
VCAYVRLGLLLALVLALAALTGRKAPTYAWTAPTALNSNAANDSWGDYVSQVTTEGGGNWVAVWYSNENVGGTIGTDYDILYAACSPVDADCPGADDDDGDGVAGVVDNCRALYKPVLGTFRAIP